MSIKDIKKAVASGEKIDGGNIYFPPDGGRHHTKSIYFSPIIRAMMHELLTHIDTLTARVAELEKRPREYTKAVEEENKRLRQRLKLAIDDILSNGK